MRCGVWIARRSLSVALNARRQAFVIAYAETGNASEAARRAGYSEKTAYSTGEQLLRNPEIQQAVKELAGTKMSAGIATAEERQLFWSKVMQDNEQDMKDRLRASELLGKRQGDFIERSESRVEIIIRDETD